MKSGDSILLCAACLRKSIGERHKERVRDKDEGLGRTEVDRTMQLERSRAASRERRGKPGNKPKGKGPEKAREEHCLQHRMKHHWA